MDKESASLKTSNELPVPIQGANHRNICKFETSESQKYRPVYNALQAMFFKVTEIDDTCM